MTKGEKVAATRKANREAMSAMASDLATPTGEQFVMGKTCITCLQPQVAFPSDQLPNTSPRYPQCTVCLGFEYRRIARVAAGASS